MTVLSEAPAVPEVDGRRFELARALFAGRKSRFVGGLLVAIVLIAAIGPALAPYGANEQNPFDRLQGPGRAHWLGTDSLGRDVFTLLLHGLRLSLIAGTVAVGVATLLGVPAGLIAGYARGWFQAVMNTISDVLLSIPPIIFALSVIGILGPGLTNAMVAVGVLLAPRLYRIARATTQSVCEKTFIEASRSVGCSTARLLLHHVLTNSIAPLLVQMTFGFGLAIVVEASLSFIGIGTQPPDSSLGTMVADAFENVNQNSWPIYPPSLLVAVLVYLIAGLGDAMQDALKTGGST